MNVLALLPFTSLAGGRGSRRTEHAHICICSRSAAGRGWNLQTEADIGHHNWSLFDSVDPPPPTTSSRTPWANRGYRDRQWLAFWRPACASNDDRLCHIEDIDNWRAPCRCEPAAHRSCRSDCRCCRSSWKLSASPTDSATACADWREWNLGYFCPILVWYFEECGSSARDDPEARLRMAVS